MLVLFSAAEHRQQLLGSHAAGLHDAEKPREAADDRVQIEDWRGETRLEVVLPHGAVVRAADGAVDHVRVDEAEMRLHVERQGGATVVCPSRLNADRRRRLTVEQERDRGAVVTNYIERRGGRIPRGHLQVRGYAERRAG